MAVSFWQIEIEETDREGTNVASHHELYIFIQMTTGMKNASETRQSQFWDRRSVISKVTTYISLPCEQCRMSTLAARLHRPSRTTLVAFTIQKSYTKLEEKLYLFCYYRLPRS